MFDLVLYEPEIPPNTGAIIRLSANSGCRLHLIKPLGFTLDDKRMRRAGLDYHEWARVQIHESWQAALELFQDKRMFALTTKGARIYTEATFKTDDVFILGPETRGLPDSLLNQLPPRQRLKIPMREGGRSLNLANAASIIVYEAWRQLGFN